MYEEKQWKRLLVLFGLVLVILILFVFVFRNFQQGKQRSIPGIRAPIQTVTTGEKHIKRKGYELTLDYLYAYDIEGLVITTKNYNGSSLDDELSPKDVGLAWGNVAKYNTQLGIHWVAKHRALEFKDDENSWGENQVFVGSVEDALKQISNNHLIVLDSSIRESVKKIKVGDHIRIKGYLVNIEGDNSMKHFSWCSSTSRDDTGCEVILVESVEWLD